MESRPPVEVVCALIEDEVGRLLLARRPPGKHLAGLWEFPGGKVEPGETPAEALVREIEEELGCRAVPGEALTPVSHAYATVTVRLIPLLARIAPGERPPEAREHAELRWVAAAELGAYAMPEADRPIVAEWLTLRTASASDS